MKRAPGLCWQRALWGYDAKGGRIVSVAVLGSQKDSASIPAMFSSSDWSDSSVVLVADTLPRVPPFPSRFSYRRLEPSTLKMTWELMRNGSWVLGDSLMCRPAPAAR